MTTQARAATRARVSVERRWRAMGSDAQLIVVGVTDTEADDAVAERLEDVAVQAAGRVAELEGLWSRFLPTSEVSTLNRLGWAVVSAETFALIDRAVLAWRRTDGRFDPTRLGALEHLGYDRSFEQFGRLDGRPHLLIRRTRRILPSLADAGAPVASLPMGCAGIVLEPFTRTVILPAQFDRRGEDPVAGQAAAFDAGGMGKGYAADLVVEELLASGAAGALLNLGGDLRVEGVPPSGDSWVVEVGESAWSSEPLAMLELERGAVATSTPLRRRWSVGSSTTARSSTETAHHLLDAETGRSTENGPVLVTAIAGRGWWAEAAATAVAATPLTDQGGSHVPVDRAAVVTVGPDGDIRFSGGFERFGRLVTAGARPARQPDTATESKEKGAWIR